MIPVIILILAAMAMVILISFWAFNKAFYSSPNRKENIFDLPNDDQYSPHHALMTDLISEMSCIPYEEVKIVSFDGTELFGRYYQVLEGAPLQIQFHGYRGSAFRDFCGGNKLAREMRQNTLLVDQRAHGKSSGTVITFGVKERFDCLYWANYAAKRFGPKTPIVLAGVSMGAATVLMASDLGLPNSVVGIIADCPYSSPSDIIRKVCKDMGLPPSISFQFVKIGAKLFGHFNIEAASAKCAVKNANIPILIIHGEDDRFVPYEMSKEIESACSGKGLCAIFPGAGHGLSYIVDPQRYEYLIKDFCQKCIK